MEYEKILNFANGLRVLLRNTRLGTYVLLEVDKSYFIQLDVDKWTEFTKSIAAINHEFHRRFNTRSNYPEIEYEKILIVTNGLRVVLRNTSKDTVVMIEVDGRFIVALKADDWVNLKNNIGVIQQEFYKRFNYQYVEEIHPEEEEMFK